MNTKRNTPLAKALACALMAFCSYALVMGQTYYRGDPSILVPQSSVPVKGQMHTHYLIKRNPGAGIDYPRFGPSLAQVGAGGYAPADIQRAYNIPASGGSEAI